MSNQAVATNRVVIDKDEENENRLSSKNTRNEKNFTGTRNFKKVYSTVDIGSIKTFVIYANKPFYIRNRKTIVPVKFEENNCPKSVEVIKYKDPTNERNVYEFITNFLAVEHNLVIALCSKDVYNNLSDNDLLKLRTIEVKEGETTKKVVCNIICVNDLENRTVTEQYFHKFVVKWTTCQIWHVILVKDYIKQQEESNPNVLFNKTYKQLKEEGKLNIEVVKTLTPKTFVSKNKGRESTFIKVETEIFQTENFGIFNKVNNHPNIQLNNIFYVGKTTILVKGNIEIDGEKYDLAKAKDLAKLYTTENRNITIHPVLLKWLRENYGKQFPRVVAADEPLLPFAQLNSKHSKEEYEKALFSENLVVPENMKELHNEEKAKIEKQLAVTKEQQKPVEPVRQNYNSEEEYNNAVKDYQMKLMWANHS